MRTRKNESKLAFLLFYNTIQINYRQLGRNHSGNQKLVITLIMEKHNFTDKGVKFQPQQQ